MNSEHPLQYDTNLVGLTMQVPIAVCTNHLGTDQPFCVRRGGQRQETPQANDQRYVEIHSPTSNYVCPQHCHTFYEIAFIRRGTLIHDVPDGQVTLKRGDVLILAPNSIHGYEIDQTVCYTDIFLLPQWLLEDLKLLWNEKGIVRRLLTSALFNLPLPQGYLHLKTTEAETAQWEREIVDMEAESRLPDPSLLTIHGCLLRILGVLNRTYLRTEANTPIPIEPEIWEAAQWIEQTITHGSPFKVGNLAQTLGTTTRSLQRRFKNSTGLAPLEYYQQRRIDHAQRLLTTTKRSITTLAHELGFTDMAHMSRLFKKHTGMTPGQYRNQINEKESP